MADLGSSIQSLLQIPGLQELVNNGITQQRQNMPLRTAINQQAVNMLPNSAFGRPNMWAVPQANYATPPPSSSGTDWTKILAALGAGIGGGSLLSKLLNGAGGSGGSGGGGNLANLLKLFQRSPKPFTHPTPGTPVTASNPFDNLFRGWDIGPTNPAGPNFQPEGPGLTPNVTTEEFFNGLFGPYGGGGLRDEGPTQDLSPWGGGGETDQGPNDGFYHP